MRNLSASALTKIAEHQGNEPITIIDVEWTDGSIIQYADRDISAVKGKILDVSNLDAIINISGTSDSQEINVILDDTDGEIKDIMDEHDIHMRNVWVYQWFEGLSFSDRFLLFKGKINSPITWNEGERTVSFTILTQIEDNEVGFSPEEGQIADLPQELIGQPWPMIFGTVEHSKTINLTARLRGNTGGGIGFPDFALEYRLQALQTICNAAMSTTGIIQTYRFVEPHCRQWQEVSLTLQEQRATIVDSVYIFHGSQFPRGNITLDIGGVSVSGHFGSGSSNTFYIDGGSGKLQNHPAWQEYTWVPGFHYYERLGDPFAPFSNIKVLPYATGWTYSYTDGSAGGFVPDGGIKGENAGYVYVEPGSTVKLSAVEPQTYIVSITPGEVLRVVAWTNKNGQRFIQDIPSNWYTVEVKNYGIFPVTLITLTDALSKKEDFGFEDDIYVTFKSDIGPNTVDILEYIIDTFSDFEIDTTSFNHVKTKLANYPSDFALYDKKNIVNLLQEISWQARCAIYLKNGKFYLLYLPEEQTPVDTLDENDVLVNTLILDHTPTEDIVTKMVCEWTASGIQKEPYKTILRHNVSKYGMHEQIFDFYIYDFVDAVVKSATFWLIRYANTWKKVRFNVPLTKLNLETFDSINLDLGNIIANETILALLESSNYDSNSNTLALECWCPVKAGTMTTYDFAYSGDQLAWKTFPTDYEIQEGYEGGNGPGKQIEIDSSLPEFLIWTTSVKGLPNEYDPPSKRANDDPYNNENSETDDRRKNDRGGAHPGDVGDSSPGDKIINPGGTMEESDPGPDSGNQDGNPIPQPDGWGGKNTFPENPEQGPGDEGAEGVSEGEGTGSDTQDALNELPPCSSSACVGCPKVKVLWAHGIVSTYLGSPPCDDPFGYVCQSSDMSYETICFNTNAEAQAYAAAIDAMITHKGAVGQSTPWTATYISGTEDCQGTGASNGATAYCGTGVEGAGAGYLLDGMVQT